MKKFLVLSLLGLLAFNACTSSIEPREESSNVVGRQIGNIEKLKNITFEMPKGSITFDSLEVGKNFSAKDCGTDRRITVKTYYWKEADRKYAYSIRNKLAEIDASDRRNWKEKHWYGTDFSRLLR